jgi:DNA recombination-dependent growth factor C
MMKSNHCPKINHGNYYGDRPCPWCRNEELEATIERKEKVKQLEVAITDALAIIKTQKATIERVKALPDKWREQDKKCLRYRLDPKNNTMVNPTAVAYCADELEALIQEQE